MRALPRFIIAIIIPLATFFVQWMFWPYVEPFAWFLFYPAVFFAVVFSDVRGGIISTLISTVLVWYVFVPVPYSFALADSKYIISIISFAFMGIGFSFYIRYKNQQLMMKMEDAKLKQVLDHAADAVFIVNKQGRYLYVNKQATCLLGYTTEELLNLSISDITSPDQLAPALDAFKKLVDGGAMRIETFLKHKSGRVVAVDLNTVVLPDGNLFGSCRDITEQKNIEYQLRSSEAQLRVAQHLAGIGSWVWDIQKDTHVWSEALYRIFRHDPSKKILPYPDIKKYIKEEHWQVLSAEIEKCKSDGGKYTCEIEFVREDETYAWGMVHGEATRDEMGRIHLLYCTIQDITERKLALLQYHEHLEALVEQRTKQLETANHSMAEQQRFLRTITDAMPGMIGYWDHTLHCQFANAAYRYWFNKSPETMLGIGMKDFMGEELFSINYPHIEGALKGEPQLFKRALTRSDGKIGHTLISYIPDISDHHVRGFFVMVTDISEIKQAEDQLATLNTDLALRVKQAEAATRSKSIFLANMSHEIRTPLNGILGMAYLMRQAGVSPLQAEQLDKIAASGKYLLRIINDVLDISKVEAGKIDLEDKEFVLSEMIQATLAVVSEQLKSKNLKLFVKVSGLPKLLRGDPTRLSQALVNYLSNAAKFTAQGSVTLRGSVEEETDHDYCLRFEVSDTGIGIAPEVSSKIFDAFEQADDSTTRKYGGTGLGLTITRHIVHMMHGEVGLTSTLGQGSQFWFTVRVGKGSPAAHSNLVIEESPEAQLRKKYVHKRVLIAEDDPINQEVASMLLKEVGIESDLVSDGVQALLRVKEQSYDLILMDMQMPEMDGLNATRAIRQLPHCVKLPIIAMTANAFAEDRNRCLAVGMNDFISKPVEPAVLYRVMLTWLSKDLF